MNLVLFLLLKNGLGIGFRIESEVEAEELMSRIMDTPGDIFFVRGYENGSGEPVAVRISEIAAVRITDQANVSRRILTPSGRTN
jgi:hypothetical protein